MTIHEQIKDCEKSIDMLQKCLVALKKNAIYCPKCKTYYEKDKEKLTTTSKPSHGCSPSLVDSDDDDLYDCTLITTWRICPLCNGYTDIKHEEVGIHNTRPRWKAREQAGY